MMKKKSRTSDKCLSLEKFIKISFSNWIVIIQNESTKYAYLYVWIKNETDWNKGQ